MMFLLKWDFKKLNPVLSVGKFLGTWPHMDCVSFFSYLVVWDLNHVLQTCMERFHLMANVFHRLFFLALFLKSSYVLS